MKQASSVMKSCHTAQASGRRKANRTPTHTSLPLGECSRSWSRPIPQMILQETLVHETSLIQMSHNQRRAIISCKVTTSVTLQIFFEKKRSGRSGQQTKCRQRTLTRRTLPLGKGSHTRNTDSWHVESLTSSARDSITAQESECAHLLPTLGSVTVPWWLESVLVRVYSMETGKCCKSRYSVCLFVLAFSLEADINHLPAHHCGTYPIPGIDTVSRVCMCVCVYAWPGHSGSLTVCVCVCVCKYNIFLSLIIHSLQNFSMK